VRFEKEGACWYLRIFIDHENGITIEDCEKMTEPVNQLLDKLDPISQNYILEVGSAGLEREFNRSWHFAEGAGTEVRARAIRPIDGEREWIGTLQSCEADTLVLQTETGPVSLPLAALTFVKRYEAFEF
jgi:ribosome maturation factor RimP